MKKISSISLPTWLICLLSGVFILRVPSLFEPYYYGDEMIYLDLGVAVRRGLTLYKDIHDNKPPLLYYLAAISGNVFWFRAILLFWMLATIVLFWFFVKKLFKNQKSAIAGTIAFAILTTLPFFEGNTPNAELFMIGPIIGAVFLSLKKDRLLLNSFLAGLLLSVATLFKVPSVFDTGMIVVFWFFALKPKRNNVFYFIKRTVLLGLGILLPIIVTFVWFTLRGAFHEYLVAAFLQNFGYVSSWRGAVVQTSFLAKNGPLLIRAVLVLVSFVFLWFMRKRRSAAFMIACLWLVTSLFAITLSERPYPHYFVQALPAISLLFGLLIADETIEQTLTVIPLMVAFLVPVYFQFWQYSSSHYFGRFIEFAQTQDKEKYLGEFSPEVSRNYKIAEFVKGHTSENDKVFVWGGGEAIYALSGRLPPIKYVADYHIHDFSSPQETIDGLLKNTPKMIVILPEAAPFDELNNFTQKEYLQLQQIEGAQVWYNTTP